MKRNLKYLLIIWVWHAQVSFCFCETAGYFIFQFEGNVLILSEGKQLPCSYDYNILEQDSIKILQGWITLIDDQVRRVTLDKPGTYSPVQIQSYFAKALESRENKFLSYLYKKMKSTPQDGSQKGGVVRGEEALAFPPDSTILLDNFVHIRFKSGNELPVHFSIMDLQGNILLEESTMDSTLLIRNDLGWCSPGVYRWKIEYANSDELNRFFIIPDADVRLQYLNELEYMQQAFPDLPDHVCDDIIDAFLKENKWITTKTE